MKRGNKIWLGLALLIGGSAGYCSLPLKSVATLTVTLTDQNGQPIKAGASAAFLDSAGVPIFTVKSGMPYSWANSLHWWSHSSHATSAMRPADAIRAAAVRVGASGCEPVTVPVVLVREFSPLSFSMHGGGAAYMHYQFARTVMLQCGA